MTLPQYPVLPQELSKLRGEKESAGTMNLLPQGSEEFKDTDLFIFRFFCLWHFSYSNADCFIKIFSYRVAIDCRMVL